MGIKNLNSFLKKHCPSVFKHVELSSYKGKTLAIDISLYLFKYKALYAEKWLNAFVNLICVLKRNGIDCIFVYDNGAPPEKKEEQDSRRSQRDKLRAKIEQLEKDISNYEKNEVMTDLLRQISEKGDKEKKRLLLNHKSGINIKYVKGYLNKIKRQCISISEEDFEVTKALFDVMSIPYVMAREEAEAYCANLCVNGLIYGVVSEDTDVLTYNTPVFVTNLDVGKEECIELRIHDILEALSLTYSQFRDLCIMFGTDYNKNIKGVGPETTYKLITEYKSIDNLPEKYDKTILNHERSRELFTTDKELSIEIAEGGVPDWNALQEFMFKNNCRMDMNYIRSCII
jgi:5'-3' exonuclease